MGAANKTSEAANSTMTNATQAGSSGGNQSASNSTKKRFKKIQVKFSFGIRGLQVHLDWKHIFNILIYISRFYTWVLIIIFYRNVY
jgi:hypothetical protein